MEQKYERLKKLERDKARLDIFFREFQLHPNLVFSSIRARRVPFWEQTAKSKRIHGMPQIIDVPEELGLYDMVIAKINEKYEDIIKEFNDLLAE